jgi:hypothetical protein
LSLSSGSVRGEVTDPSGTVRTFSPLIVSESAAGSPRLDPGKFLEASLTLFGGRQGSLFPQAGVYRLLVEASWLNDGLGAFSVGTATITVSDAVDAAHANAARTVLDTPETLLVIALGGDHLKEGIAAVGAALDNAVLRPHFAYVEAKRLATRFGNRLPDLAAAGALIDGTTVMSSDEFRKAVQIVSDNAGSDGAQALVQSLKARVAAGGVSDEIRALVEAL